MYFLSHEERKYILRGLVPRAREVGVAEDLRGWNWHQPPLEPIFDVRLGVAEIANRYCDTGRDVFWRRVMGKRGRPSPPILGGRYFHDVLVQVITRAKVLLYKGGVSGYRNALKDLAEPLLPPLPSLPDGDDQADGWVQTLMDQGRELWEFEHQRISARVREVLARQPYIHIDALVHQALPVVVEQRLDGTFLGLSPQLATDALVLAEPVVMDLKFGDKRDFHRLSIAGYALVMEALFEYPVNIGCISYARYHQNRWLVERDAFIIDDELRQWFIEERDAKMRMVFDQIDPGLATGCVETCPYYSLCQNAE